jgi:hypothetical protein
MGWLDEGIEPGWVRAAAAVADVLAWGRSTGSCRAPSPVPCRRRAPRGAARPPADRRRPLRGTAGRALGGLCRGRDRRAVAGTLAAMAVGAHALEVEGRETLADLNARVAGALAQLFAELVDGRVGVVFTHGAVARAAVAWALGTGPEIYRHVEVAN